MDTKFCKKCGKIRNITDFYSYKGIAKTPCKICKTQYQNNYYSNNKEAIEVYRKEYYNNNKTHIIQNQLVRDSLRKDEIAASQKAYRKNNKDKFKIYKKTKKSKPEYKLRSRVSNSIYQTLKLHGSSKKLSSSFKNLGYSVHDLKKHLESQFESWMTWENHGQYNPNTWNDDNKLTWTWQIDHIIPQSLLPYKSLDDDNFKKCWALSNLRPLNSKQNIFDGSNRVRHYTK